MTSRTWSHTTFNISTMHTPRSQTTLCCTCLELQTSDNWQSTTRTTRRSSRSFITACMARARLCVSFTDHSSWTRSEKSVVCSDLPWYSPASRCRKDEVRSESGAALPVGGDGNNANNTSAGVLRMVLVGRVPKLMSGPADSMQQSRIPQHGTELTFKGTANDKWLRESQPSSAAPVVLTWMWTRNRLSSR